MSLEEERDLLLELLSSGYTVVQYYQGIIKVRRKANGKYGLCKDNGQIICEAIYDEIKDFVNGFAKVRIDQLWGFINLEGKEICPIKYTKVYDFEINGLARVEWLDKVDYIDKTGKELCALEYNGISDYIEGYAIVRKQEKYGFVDETGRVIGEVNYDKVTHFHNGFAFVKYDGKWRIINRNGFEIFHFAFDKVSYFIEGVAVVKLKSRYFYINEQFEELVFSEQSWFKNLKNELRMRVIIWKFKLRGEKV